MHWIVAGFVLPMMDGMNPCAKEGRIKPFGLFGKNYGGMMIMGFLVGHFVYGVVVGLIYRVPGS